MPLLEVNDVTVKFGGVTAVNGATFRVEEGTVAALIGPNGAGKTTTFNVVTGLQPPTAGRVTFAERDVTKLAVHERARLGVGRTFQRLEVFGSLSVRENVLVAAEIHQRHGGHGNPRAVAEQVIDRVGIRAFADAPADTVPTGVARLTELGRALACEPRLLLLDEPSSGLDEEESDRLATLLRELADAEGRAILLVEHDVELVMSTCDWIDVLDFGTIIASGPPAAIQADPTVQAAYLGEDPRRGSEREAGGQAAPDAGGSRLGQDPDAPTAWHDPATVPLPPPALGDTQELAR